MLGVSGVVTTTVFNTKPDEGEKNPQKNKKTKKQRLGV